MQINSAQAEGGGGASAPDLVVNRDDLGAIGNDAYDLRTRLSKDGDHARPATFAAAIALTNGNFASGSAVLKVHDFWQKHLKTLLDSCAHISNHLDYTKAQHAKDDGHRRSPVGEAEGGGRRLVGNGGKAGQARRSRVGRIEGEGEQGEPGRVVWGLRISTT